MLCYLVSSISGLGWRTSWRATAKKLPVTISIFTSRGHMLGHRLMGLLFKYSEDGMYSLATPGLLNAWNSSRSSTILSFIYLALKTNSVQRKTLLCIYGMSTLDMLRCTSKASFWTSSKWSVLKRIDALWRVYTIQFVHPWQAVLQATASGFPSSYFTEKEKCNHAKDLWKNGSTGSTPT